MTITRVDGLEMFAKFRHGPFIDTDPMLDRCRHCGSEAGYREHEYDKLLRVECSNTSCGIATPYHYKTRELALKAWNRTPENPPVYETRTVSDPEIGLRYTVEY
jgi:hypothetical protein